VRPAPDPLLLSMLRGDDATAADADGWRRAAVAARAEGLELWFRHRRAGTAPAVPDDVRERLRDASVGITARALALASELAAILRALAAAGVACAPLRGVALAERVWDDACARPAGDIDLLVRRADLDAVEAMLHALGYRGVDRRHGFAREFSYTLELVRDAHGGVVVEPHWTLAYPPFADAVDMDRVWARCRPGRVAGEPALLLPPEALLLNLCLHVVHKAPDVPLLWLTDIDRLVRREAIDWDELVVLARGAQVGGQVAAVLSLVTSLLRTPLPAHVGEALGGANPAALDRLLVKGADVDGRESLALLFALAGIRRRARYAASLLFPSPAFMTMEYGVTGPGPLACAYGRRVRHFVWAGVRGTARLLRRI
jgi:Uncharacterised nucleotidyltransferase